jgi:hypothetical protein
MAAIRLSHKWGDAEDDTKKNKGPFPEKRAVEYYEWCNVANNLRKIKIFKSGLYKKLNIRTGNFQC